MQFVAVCSKCVAVCCSVLQCVAVCCSVLQCDCWAEVGGKSLLFDLHSAHKHDAKPGAYFCSVLQCVVVSCQWKLGFRVLQCVASVL